MIDVSVCIITFNQEKYVAQAIESALFQKGVFSSEIVICDDSSSDTTPEIIQSYALKYPDRIKVCAADKNLGMLRNWARALKLCTGKYIALLEGDDFWTDENKLQKQYQILEGHSEYVISFTNAKIKYEDGPQGFPDYVTETKEIYTTADLINYNFIPTCSVLMRNNISDSFFHPAYFESPFADWIIHILNSKFGKIHFLNEFTCTYRVHGSGVWGGLKEENQLKNKWKAINCVASIATEDELQKSLQMVKGESLQKLCAYYRKNGRYTEYMKYRLKLLLN